MLMSCCESNLVRGGAVSAWTARFWSPVDIVLMSPDWSRRRPGLFFGWDTSKAAGICCVPPGRMESGTTALGFAVGGLVPGARLLAEAFFSSRGFCGLGSEPASGSKAGVCCE